MKVIDINMRRGKSEMGQTLILYVLIKFYCEITISQMSSVGSTLIEIREKEIVYNPPATQ